MTLISVMILPVSQRGDDQTVCAAQVLILINEVHVCDGH